MDSDMTDLSVPPTEPITATPPPPPGAPVKRRPGRPRKNPLPPTSVTEPARIQQTPVAQGRVRGDDLMADLDARSAGVDQSAWYWLGVLPGCPVIQIDMAGMGFPIAQELVVYRQDGRPADRVPVIGGLMRLNGGHIRKLQDQIPRTVIRFKSEPGQHEEPGTGQNIGDLPARQPRKGFVITIPSEKDIETGKQMGRHVRPYVRQPNDEPAAKYMFCVPCEDQTKGSRGGSYPEPLSVTGLVFPEEVNG